MSLAKTVQAIKKGKTFLVCSHLGPDGDAMASTLAMGLGLEKLKKKVVYYNQDVVPETLRFLPGSKKVIHTLKPSDSFDVAIVMDCGAFERLGKKFSEFKGYKTLINVDHHSSNTFYGDINYIVSDASSSGEVVWDVLKKLGCSLTSDIATNIYCTLVTDTGSFRYSNTDEHALKLAAQMVKAGASPWEVAKNLFESQPYVVFVLLGRLLERLKISKDGRYSWSIIFLKDYEETGATYEMTEDFINYPRAIQGVEVGMVFKEWPGGNKYKVSLRSKTNLDVSKICAEFGGGGHRAAAACVISGSYEDVLQRVISKVEKALKEEKK